MFTLTKFRAIIPATVTRESNSNSHVTTCLGYLGRHDISINDPISVAPPKVAEASTVVTGAQRKFFMLLLLLVVSLTIITNVNDPLPG